MTDDEIANALQTAWDLGEQDSSEFTELLHYSPGYFNAINKVASLLGYGFYLNRETEKCEVRKRKP